MKVAIITVAGISSRFNEGIAEEQKTLKSIFWEKDCKHTLLFHLLEKCSFADCIVVVGGYRYDSLKTYCQSLDRELQEKIILVYNEHFSDLGSGYSLYLGLNAVFEAGADDEILFVEGDLDIDEDSFDNVIHAKGNVLTYNYRPIYTKKAVVLYKDIKDNYRYAFNSDHGYLKIESAFSCILNSGQIWKFTEIQKLKKANEKFYKDNKAGTNLEIIQNYLNENTKCELIGLKRWTNCNTREDFKQIMSYWEEEA